MKGLLSLPLFFIGLFYGRTGACQDTSSRFAVVLSPALFVPVTVAAQGGLQYRLSRHWSLLGEVAVPTFYPKNTQYETIKYLRTGIEVKYYSDAHRSNKSYVSFQSNYLFRKLTDKDQNFYYTKTQTFSYQNAFINSPVLSSALYVVKMNLAPAPINPSTKVLLPAFISIPNFTADDKTGELIKAF